MDSDLKSPVENVLRPIRCGGRRGGNRKNPKYRRILLEAARTGRPIDVWAENHRRNLRQTICRHIRRGSPDFAGLRMFRQQVGPRHWIVRVAQKKAALPKLPNDPGFEPRPYKRYGERLVRAEILEFPTRHDALKAQAAFSRIPRASRLNLGTRITRLDGKVRIEATQTSSKPLAPKPQPRKEPNPYGRGRGIRWLRHVVTQMLHDRYADPTLPPVPIPKR